MNDQYNFDSAVLTSNRIPKDYFTTKGKGESDITIHAGSYHLALKDAGIEVCNIIAYSSILPAIAREVKKPDSLLHGSVLETIIAAASAKKGERATAGIINGWLYDKATGKKHGGLVCEYSGGLSRKDAGLQLRASIDELYTNGFSGKYDLKNIKLVADSFVPKKNFGTVIVAICFLNYVWPIEQVMR